LRLSNGFNKNGKIPLKVVQGEPESKEEEKSFQSTLKKTNKNEGGEVVKGKKRKEKQTC